MVVLTVALFVTTLQAVHAEPYQDKADFASDIEETLGHFLALEQNLDDGNATLALTHATHPIAELYDAMKPVLKAADPDLDAQVLATLEGLKDKVGSDMTKEQALQAVDDARQVMEMVRTAVVGDELSDDPAFKMGLMKTLLETSVAEYGEAVSDGVINEMAEFQDGAAFVWRSQQIFETIKDDVDPTKAANIENLYGEIYAAYDARADPVQVEIHTVGITADIDAILGVDDMDKDLLVYVENIRVMLEDAKQAYSSGDKDLALSLATKAYLDNYEFLEAPLIELGHEELMEKVEVMLREDLRNMIKDDADPSEVDAQIESILIEMDSIAVIVPEFGTIAMMILAISIVSIVAVSARTRLSMRM